MQRNRILFRSFVSIVGVSKVMKNKWVLIALGLTGLSGCIVPGGGLGSSGPDYQYDPSTGGYVSVAEAAYYDEPLYSYGNTNYYYVSGRYMYDDGYGPTYVDRLPYGGYYNQSHPVYPCRTSASIAYARSRPISSAPVLSVTNKVVVNKTYVQQTNVRQTNIGQVNIGSSASSAGPRSNAPSAGVGSPWGGHSATGGAAVKSSHPSGVPSLRGTASSEGSKRETQVASEPTGMFSGGTSPSGGVAPRSITSVQGRETKPSSMGGVSPSPSTMGGATARPTTVPVGGTPRKDVSGVGPRTAPSNAVAPRTLPPAAPASSTSTKKKTPGTKPD